MSRQPFDAFEVHKVAEYRAGYDDAYCEPIVSASDQQRADEEASSQFWTVYGHRSFPDYPKAPPIDDEASDDSGLFVNGVQVTRAYYDEWIAWEAGITIDTEGFGATAIGDFTERELAVDMAYALAATGNVEVHIYG